MKITETQETEELALLAELARPVVHECNNFLNNLLLQMAISENDLPESQRADWDRVRQSGKQLARLLQEWQRQRKSFADGPMRTAVQPLVQESVDAAGSVDESVQFSVRMPTEPIWLACRHADTKRLFSLVLRYALAELRFRGETQCTLEIHIRRIDREIVVQVLETGAAPSNPMWRDLHAAEGTLLSSACHSLTERLGGRIRVDNVTPGGPVLQLSLPAAD